MYWICGEGGSEGGSGGEREREQENGDWEKGGKNRAVFHFIFIYIIVG